MDARYFDVDYRPHIHRRRQAAWQNCQAADGLGNLQEIRYPLQNRVSGSGNRYSMLNYALLNSHLRRRQPKRSFM